MTEESPGERKVSRRSLLKWTGALAGVAVVGAIAGFGSDILIRPNTETTKTQTTTTSTAPPATISYKPPLSPEIQTKVDSITKDLVSRHTGETAVYAVDKMACMSDMCILKMRVKDGIITAIETDDTVNAGATREEVSLDALNKGQIQQRTCPLARAWRQEIYSPTRVLYPMKNVGTRGNATFTRISWKDATDVIADKIKSAVDKNGPYSIFSWPLDAYYKAGVRSWGANSHSGLCDAEFLTTGSQAFSVDTATQSTVFQTKLFVMWGRHPAHIEEGTWPYFLVRAKELGVPFISIDTRYTTSAEAYDAQWIPIRPGTDMAMMLAVCDVLFKENLVDQAFVDKWVEPTGLAKFKDYVLGVSDGVEKSPAWAEKLCGVPAQTIVEFTRLYAKSRPTMLIFGWGACRSMSINVSRVVIMLQVLTGNYLTAGGGDPFWGGYSKNPAPLPSISLNWAGPSLWSVPTMFNGPVKWADAILLREKVDAGQMTMQEYNGIIGNKGDSKLIPNISVLVQQATCPSVLAVQDSSKHIRAIKKVDFTFGFHRDKMNYEANFKDILLPETYFFEENGGIKSGGGTGNYQIYCPPVINCQGEARPATWFWIQLAKRLGIDKAYATTLADVCGLDEWDNAKWNAAYEAMCKAAYQAWASNPAVAPSNPPSWSDFSKKQVFRYDALQKGPMSATLAANQSPFTTASAKFEIYSKMLEDPAKVANTVVNFGGQNNNMCIGTIGSGVTPLPKWVDNVYGTFYDSQATKYPLVVISPNSIFRSHSMPFENQLLNGDCYVHRCWISLADAKARGIKDNDLVHVKAASGEMMIRAYVTSKIVPGCVAIYHGGFYVPGGMKTDLMPDGIDVGGNQNFLQVDNQPGNMLIGPTMDAGMCEVEKV